MPDGEAAHPVEHAPNELCRAWPVLLRDRTEMPIDGSGRQLPYPEVAKTRDHLTVEAVPVRLQRRRGSPLTDELLIPGLGEDGHLRLARDVSAADVDSGTVTECQPERLLRGALGLAVPFDRPGMTVEIPVPASRTVAVSVGRGGDAAVGPSTRGGLATASTAVRMGRIGIDPTIPGTPRLPHENTAG